MSSERSVQAVPAPGNAVIVILETKPEKKATNDVLPKMFFAVWGYAWAHCDEVLRSWSAIL